MEQDTVHPCSLTAGGPDDYGCLPIASSLQGQSSSASLLLVALLYFLLIHFNSAVGVLDSFMK